MEICFREATLLDVQDMIDVQDKSFLADWERFGFCPGYGHTAEMMSGMILTSQSYLIWDGEVPVGNILYRCTGEGEYYLGSLCVIPEYQGRGIGKMALAFLDELHPDAARWQLETPAENERNRYFYAQHGYQMRRQYWDGGVLVALMERRMESPAQNPGKNAANG